MDTRESHIKDMVKIDKPEFTEIGTGCLDIAAFEKAAEGIGVKWAFV